MTTRNACAGTLGKQTCSKWMSLCSSLSKYFVSNGCTSCEQTLICNSAELLLYATQWIPKCISLLRQRHSLTLNYDGATYINHCMPALQGYTQWMHDAIVAAVFACGLLLLFPIVLLLSLLRVLFFCCCISHVTTATSAFVDAVHLRIQT